MTNRDSIYKEIETERANQETVWNNASTTTKNALTSWWNNLSESTSKLQPVDFKNWTKPAVAAYRTTMVKTAAFAVAAIETIDRQGN